MSLLSGLLSVMFVIVDYWLSFAPMAIAFQAITQRGLIDEFNFYFLCAISNTIMVFSERAINSRNQN